MSINEVEKFYQEVLRPNKFMRKGPSSTKFSTSDPNKILKHLRKLINQQIKIHKKASSIIDGTPPDSFTSSIKIPIKTSRLSPYIFNSLKLDPLPSQTPQPSTKKAIPTEPKKLTEKDPITVLQVYKKKIINRKDIIKISKKVEVAIDTREIMYTPCELSEDNIEAEINDYSKITEQEEENN